MRTEINSVQQTDASYVYDDLNRIQSVTDETLAQTSFTYDPIGLLSSISRPNEVTTNYTYDPQRYFVDEIEHLNEITLLSRYNYTSDNVGNRLSMDVTAADSSVTNISYDYDLAYRLIDESYSMLGNAVSSTQYQYDRAGNRTRMVNADGTTIFSYNANDELTRIDKPDYYFEDYTYDGRGNLISVLNGGHAVSATTTYGYNAKDQLTQVTMPSALNISYDYDYLGNRVEQNIGGTVTNYLWDEFSRYGDVILETNPTNTIGYTLANGTLISQSNNGNVDYFLQDAQNSTIGIADGTGTVTSTYNYDAFGNLDESIDPLSVETSYLYTGQQFDPVYTELYSLRARYYDPSNGRFLNRDTYAYDYQNPFELNRYVYTANNPTTYTDPSGYMSKIAYAIVAGISTVVATATAPVISDFIVGTLLAMIFLALIPTIGDYIDDLTRPDTGTETQTEDEMQRKVREQLDIYNANRPVTGNPKNNKSLDPLTDPSRAPIKEGPWIINPDRDDNDPKKHITLGLNSFRRVQGIQRPVMDMNNPGNILDELENYNTPLIFFTRKINETILVNQNATAYWWDQWPGVGLSTDNVPPLGFYEAVTKVYTGDVETIHFNVEGILQINGINTYSDFIAGGTYANYNSDTPWRDQNHTSHEMYIISRDPLLCSRTIFYNGYSNGTPVVDATAKTQICGGGASGGQ